jgi:hypothetical protein
MIIATRTGTATTEMRQPPLSGIKTASIGLVSSERHARTHATDSRGSGRQQLNQETTAGVRCSGGGGNQLAVNSDFAPVQAVFGGGVEKQAALLRPAAGTSRPAALCPAGMRA